MATHVREQITVAVVAAVTGLTTTGARVYRDRDTDERPLQDDEVPGLTVDDDGEPAETITVDTAAVLERTMKLQISAHVKALSYSTTLNQILKEVEIAIAGASLVAKSAQIVEIGGREKVEAGDRPTVRQAFTFQLLYFTAAATPDVAL